MPSELDPDVLARGFLDACHRSLIDPRCDECGCPLPPQKTIAGPFLCEPCSVSARGAFQAGLRDFQNQERPDRRVHAVRLPDGFVWNHTGGDDADR